MFAQFIDEKNARYSLDPNNPYFWTFGICTLSLSISIWYLMRLVWAVHNLDFVLKYNIKLKSWVIILSVAIIYL